MSKFYGFIEVENSTSTNIDNHYVESYFFEPLILENKDDIYQKLIEKAIKLTNSDANSCDFNIKEFLRKNNILVDSKLTKPLFKVDYNKIKDIELEDDVFNLIKLLLQPINYDILEQTDNFLYVKIAKIEKAKLKIPNIKLNLIFCFV